MNKKKKGIPRLLEIAGEKRRMLIGSCILSAISAILMILPYIAVYFILAELLRNASNIIQVDAAYMMRWGTAALAGLIGGVIFMYGSGLMSHAAAYRILYNLRVRLSEHIGKLPLGYLSNTSTGIIKKTFEQNVGKIETFVAHQLPDMVNVFVTVIMIAHRLTTIQDANQIIVMQQGKIMERGDHNTLINQAGLYKKLWDAYTMASNWGIGKGGDVA